MKEYDWVELIRDRPEYTAEGVTKGMFGVIMNDRKVNGRWLVIFSEFYTGYDIADLSVREEDLRVWDEIPPDRIPPKPDNLDEIIKRHLDELTSPLPGEKDTTDNK